MVLDQAMVGFMREYGIRFLRWALGLIFFWFGALKLLGASPVAELVAKTLFFVPAEWAVSILGVWEVLVGLGLLLGVALRLILFLFWVQMVGTFLVLLLRPDIAFQRGNPLLLTMEGEFVIKNLVLIAAGLVIGSTVRPVSSS